jgi:hypothetical protein
MEAFLRLFLAWLGFEDSTVDALVAYTFLFFIVLAITAFHRILPAVSSWYERELTSFLDDDLSSAPVGSYPASPPLPRRARRAFEQAARRRSSSPPPPPPPPPVNEHDAAWYVSDRWGLPQVTPIIRTAPPVIGRYDTFLDEATEAHYCSAKRVIGPDGNWRWVSFPAEERKARLEFLASQREDEALVSTQDAGSIQTGSEERSSTPPPSGASHEVLNLVSDAAPSVASVEQPLQNHSAPLPRSVLPPPDVVIPDALSVVEETPRPSFFDQFRMFCEERRAPPKPDFLNQHRQVCEERKASWPEDQLRLQSRAAALVAQWMSVASAGSVVPQDAVPVVAAAPMPQVSAPVLVPDAIVVPPVIAYDPFVVPPPVFSTPVPVPPPLLLAPVAAPEPAPVPEPPAWTASPLSPPATFAVDLSSIPLTPTPAQRRSRLGARPAARRPANRSSAPAPKKITDIDWRNASESDLLSLTANDFGLTAEDLFKLEVEGDEAATLVPPHTRGDSVTSVAEALSDPAYLLRLHTVIARMQYTHPAFRRTKPGAHSVEVFASALKRIALLVAAFTSADPSSKVAFYASEDHRIVAFVRAFRFYKREFYDKHEADMERGLTKPFMDGLKDATKRLDVLLGGFPA